MCKLLCYLPVVLHCSHLCCLFFSHTVAFFMTHHICFPPSDYYDLPICCYCAFCFVKGILLSETSLGVRPWPPSPALSLHMCLFGMILQACTIYHSVSAEQPAGCLTYLWHRWAHTEVWRNSIQWVTRALLSWPTFELIILNSDNNTIDWCFSVVGVFSNQITTVCCEAHDHERKLGHLWCWKIHMGFSPRSHQSLKPSGPVWEEPLPCYHSMIIFTRTRECWARLCRHTCVHDRGSDACFRSKRQRSKAQNIKDSASGPWMSLSHWDPHAETCEIQLLSRLCLSAIVNIHHSTPDTCLLLTADGICIECESWVTLNCNVALDFVRNLHCKLQSGDCGWLTQSLTQSLTRLQL